MNKELRDKWVAALRSGKYQQGVNSLHNPDENTYCCLGVLAHVAGSAPSELVGLATLSGLGKLDLLGSSSRFVTAGLEETLWQLNDGVRGRQRHSFPVIADWIERSIWVEG